MAVNRFYFFGSYSSSPAFRPFIMEVESGADNKFTIPTTGGGYNYDVKTSDGQTFTGVTGNLTITFPSPNTHYDIEITGDFPRIYFENGTQRLKLIDIKQWGDIEWGSNMANAFFGCSDMTCSALDSPNLESLTDGSNMFRACSSFNPTNFNPTLENLTSGGGMFYNCSSFNPTNFNPTLKNLTNGPQMFYNCTDFTRDIMFDDPINGTVNLQSAGTMFYMIKSKKIWMQAGALTTVNVNSFQCSLLEDFRLIGMSVSFNIRYSPLLTGTAIDDLANSVADMTGQTSPTITMTTAQYNSCDTSLWTNKNWTIAQV